MSSGLFNAGSVLVPLLFGLVPAFLPPRTHAVVRWALWLALFGLAALYGRAMQAAPPSYRAVAWVTIAVSAGLSLLVLIAHTGEPRRRRRPS